MDHGSQFLERKEQIKKSNEKIIELKLNTFVFHAIYGLK